MDTTYWEAVNETNPIERVAEDLDFDVFLRIRADSNTSDLEYQELRDDFINDIEQSEREW
jgi:hypothetical protein